MERPPIVFIDRYYDDDDEHEAPWIRRRRESFHRAEWGAFFEYGNHGEERWFDDLDDALAWSREQAEIVLVRLGSSVATFYSAGQRPATRHIDGTGAAYPPWPPSRWPDYDGPPEPD